MVELKLVKPKLKFVSRTEKRKQKLVIGDRLGKFISSSNAAPVIISLPQN
jgi:hypothetical protein